IGPSMKVTGPNGSQNVPTDGSNVTLSSSGSFLAPGTYTFASTGGADGGNFTAPLTIAAPATITSPSTTTNVNVNRANGLTLTWTGGGSNSYYRILGGNSTDQSGTVGASFECVVPANVNTFTIPANVLLPLPPGNFNLIDFRAFSVGNF